jgi:cation diffusion facilitator CzcD-associated flavoprotein CzcO
MKRRLRVAIVGAGFGGIAAAVKLKQADIADISVFELSAGAGGTWFDNSYPGSEVDTESIAYSFSFMPYDWSRTHCQQPELQRYAEDTIDYFELRDSCRFSTKVDEAVWSEARRTYTLTLSTGESEEYDLLISAVGMLNIPRDPGWPGMTAFEGPMFHSARWEHEHDLSDKRVAVVGTGCTAVQVVPELAKIAKQLYLFQREAGWVLPKGERDLTESERAYRRSHPRRMKLTRLATFLRIGRFLTSQVTGTKTNKMLTDLCRQHIESSIDDPAIRALVTPNFVFGCKRPIKATTFYPALNRPNVELVPRAVTAVTPTGLIDDTGVERQVDAVVLAVGFEAADYLANLRVVGPGGVSLQDIWSGRPAAYLGITVAGMPNFFMMYGPNTNGGGPITAQHERQAEFVTRVARRMARRGFRKVDTRPRSMARFTAWVDKANVGRTAQNDGCHHYFISAGGRNSTQWPASHLTYLLMTRIPSRFGLVLTD